MTRYGPSLKKMLRCAKTKRFSMKTVILLGMQLIDCLQKLHSTGNLHMDIKPDNVLLGNSNLSRIDSS
jgi:serine/threonine protein kinase